jgi:Ricin-type beta-trefoil lectin domain
MQGSKVGLLSVVAGALSLASAGCAVAVGGTETADPLGTDTSAVAPSTQWGSIVAYGGRCLDVRNDNPNNENRVPIQIWDCTGHEEQVWAVSMNGPVTNIKTQKVMDAPFTTDHSTTWVFDWWGGDNQKWNMPSVEIHGKGDNCVDVPYGSDGSIVWMFQCWGGDNQKWFFDTLQRQIRTSDGSRCLEYTEFRAGAPVLARTCARSNQAQSWGMRSNGTFHVQNLTHADLCLDVANGSTANRTPLQLWDCNGTEAQSFFLKGPIVGVQSGKCLQLPQTSSDIVTSNGTEPELAPCNGGVNQQWEDHWGR